MHFDCTFCSHSSDGSHIMSGSENGFVYIWRTYQDIARTAPAARRDVNDSYESFAGQLLIITCYWSCTCATVVSLCHGLVEVVLVVLLPTSLMWHVRYTHVLVVLTKLGLTII